MASWIAWYHEQPVIPRDGIWKGGAGSGYKDPILRPGGPPVSMSVLANYAFAYKISFLGHVQSTYYRIYKDSASQGLRLRSGAWALHQGSKDT
eukprot:Skav227501  [mRNA]  locus=scaffold282:181334:190813:+ [translate_table: standard]